METRFIVEAQGSSEGQPLRVCISGGRLEVLGFAPGKKVAIEEEYGRLTISLLEVFEEGQLVPVEPAAAQSVPSAPVAVQVEAPAQSAPVQSPQSEAAGQSLFEQLSALRKQIASEAKVPAYIVFHDRQLRSMCESLPCTSEAFRVLPGVGASKLEKYGARFLEVIRQYAASQGEAQHEGV